MATATLTSDVDDRDESAVRLRMTLDEFNALPDDPTLDRMLIRGELWEKPMTKRNRWHARTEVLVGSVLQNWAGTQPSSRPEVYSGEVGCDWPKLESGVGIDVAVFSAELIESQEEDSKSIVGAPILAVEVLSLTDETAAIVAKVRDYLEAGTRQVWVVNPYFKTVEVHRPDASPRLFSGDDELCGDPHLPGFRVCVSSLFCG